MTLTDSGVAMTCKTKNNVKHVLMENEEADAMNVAVVRFVSMVGEDANVKNVEEARFANITE